MAGFALFGEVAVPAAGGSDANDSTAVRFNNAATLELAAEGGHPSLDVSILNSPHRLAAATAASHARPR